MSKQLNVNLSFSADTGQAKAAIQSLQSSLTSLTKDTMNKVSVTGKMTPEIQEATKAVTQLKAQLDGALNVKTGKLDLGRFSESLTKSGMTLKTYREQFERLGPEGAKAFSNLANAITTAEIPMRRINNVVTEFGVTLKNAARWQLSSTMLHGFMSSIQGAYSYAQNLNRSLNDIRIVTGNSTEQMAEFAEQANKAAKSLSTTTNEYSKASLIYFQQGLDDQQVKERTDVTIKMANVSRQSAETTSDQMTAIWNNFDDGSKSLEHYADVMTKLGAETATSSQEIATGIQKFAATADAIGLSYENAAAAITTVTAATRESAEVVGTAFKTIFARIQGLKLGETLEDGLDLNKYSAALDTIGVDVLDANGELIKMDDILEQMIGKWGNLTQAEKVATAQTVAGTRQYNQLMALMENADSYRKNQERANNADGSLNKQADIYAESWEAAQKRVRAAAEQIYKELLNDKFFINLLNGFEHVLGGVGDLIKGLGGLKGVLLTISALATKIFAKQMAQGIENLKYNLSQMTKSGRENIENQRKEAFNQMTQMHVDDGTASGETQQTNLQQTANLQKLMIENASKMSAEELKQNQLLMDQHSILQRNAEAAAKNVDQQARAVDEMSRTTQLQAQRNARQEGRDFDRQGYREARSKLANDARTYVNDVNAIESVRKSLKQLTGDQEQVKQKAEEMKKALQDIPQENVGSLQEKLKNLISQLIDGTKDVEQFTSSLDDINFNNNADFGNSLIDFGNNAGVAAEMADAMGQELVNLYQEEQNLNSANQATAQSAETLAERFRNAGISTKAFSDGIVATAHMMMTIGMAISSLKGMIDTLSDPDTSGLDKMVSVLTTLGMIIPMIIGSFSSLNIQQIAVVSQAVAVALGFNTEAVAAVAAGTANMGLAASLWAVLAPLLPIIAAIGALVGLIYLCVTAQTAEAAAAERAAKTAEDLSKNYDECKKSYEDMISSMSEYEEATDALDSLTKGTEEYKEALDKANEAALTLMQNHPEQFKEEGKGKDYYWDNDRLVLSQKAMNSAKSAEREKVETASATSRMATADSKAADVTNEIKMLRNTVADEVMLLRNQGQQISANDLKTMKQADYNLVQKVMDLYSQDKNLFSNKDYFANKMGLDEDGVYVNALWENIDGLKTCGDASLQAAQMVSQAAEANTRALLNDNKDVQNSNDRDTITEQSAKIYEDRYKAEKEKLEQDRWGKDGISKASGYSNEEAQKVFAEYAEAAKIVGATLVDVIGSDDNRSFQYKNAEGEVQAPVTLDEMIDVVAASRANDQTETAATALAQAAAQLDAFAANQKDNAGNAAIADTMKDFLLGNGFDNSNKSAINYLSDFVSTKDKQGNINIDPSKTTNLLAAMLGGEDGTFDDTDAQAYGYQTAQEFIDSFNQGLEEAQKNWEALKPPEGLMNADDLSADAVNKYNQMYQNAYDQGKSTVQVDPNASFFDYEAQLRQANEAASNYANSMMNNINDIVSTIDPEKQTEALEVLADIDWSNWDAASEAIQKLDDMGLSSDKTAEKIESLTNSMRDLNGAMKDYGTVKNSANDKDVDPKEYERLSKYIKTAAKSLDDFSDELATNEKAAKKTAAAILRYDSAVEDVTKNHKKWLTALKSGNLQDQAEAVDELGNAYADLLDIDVSSLSNDFITNADNLELMRQAANGSEEAYRSLQQAAAMDILAHCGLDTDQYFEDLNMIQNAAATTNGEKLADVEAGASLDNTAFLAALTEIANKSFETAQQATDYFSTMGIDAEVVVDKTSEPENSTYVGATANVTTQQVQGTNPLTQEPVTYNVPSITYTPQEVPVQATKEGTGIGLKVVSANKSSGGGVKFNNSSNGGGSKGRSGGGSSGGGSKPKGGGSSGGGSGSDSSDVGSKPARKGRRKILEPTDPKKVKDEIERYHEIEKVINDTQREIENLSEIKDIAYGPDKLRAMDREIGKNKDLLRSQKALTEEARNYLKADKELLEFYDGQIDENGRVINYDEYITYATNQYNEAIAAIDKERQRISDERLEIDFQKDELSDMDEGETKWAEEDKLQDLEDWLDTQEENLDKLEKEANTAFEDRTEALTQYEETQDKVNDTLQEELELERQIAEAILEKIEYAAEYKNTIQDNSLKIIDYYLEEIEDDFTKSVEGITLLTNKFNPLIKQAKNTVSVLDEMKIAMADSNNHITLDQIIQKTIDSIPDLVDRLAAINDQDREYMEYYGNALEKWNDEYSKQYDLIGHNIDKLDQYKNLLSLLGKQKDFVNMAVVLEGQRNAAQKAYEASKRYRDSLLGQYEDIQTKYNNAVSANNEYLTKLYKTQLDAIREALNDAEDQMLNDLEQVTEAANAILENALEEAKDKLSKGLFGGSMDLVMEQLERLTKSQEEYLTKTNKLYETNKLIRQAQQDIDKTTNLRAKQQYENYTKYIEQLQQSGDLSNYELSIAQAKYEVLKAQIALEEAQDAKSEVRLQRDSEGNFGYVYTASQDEISKAQDKLNEAENKLYNIGLNGLKDYQSKIYANRQEYLEKLNELEDRRKNGEIESETKYLEEQQQIIKYYRGQEKIYLEQYYKATDLMEETSYNNRVDYRAMDLSDLGNFNKVTNQYLQDVDNAWDNVALHTKEASDATSRTNIAEETAEVKTETDNLTNAITGSGGLVDSFDEQYKGMDAILTAYQNEYNELHDNIIPSLKEEISLRQQLGQIASEEYEDYSQALADYLKVTPEDQRKQEIIDYFVQKHFEKAGGVDVLDYSDLMEQAGLGTPEYEAFQYIREAKIQSKDLSDWIRALYNNGKGLARNDAFIQELAQIRDRKIARLPEEQRAGIISTQDLLNEIFGYDVETIDEPWVTFSDGTGIDDEPWVTITGSDGIGRHYEPWVGVIGEQGQAQNYIEQITTSTLQSVSNSIDSAASNLIQFLSASMVAGNVDTAQSTQTIEQNVTVQAEFPNAVDHNEIETALNGIVNAASQYVGTK